MATLLRWDERDWRRSNDLRRRLRHRWFEREVLKGGERPVRYAFSLTFLLGLTISIGYFLPAKWLDGYWGGWLSAEQLNLFTSLWSIQATIAALVYPFVIAFVALLLQRRPSSKAFLQIYLIDSGGLVAGLSSLFLVLAMAAQYLMLSLHSLNSLVVWVAADSVWFIYNLALTIFFVFRTVEFLRPDFQMEVIKRYAVNVALPREIANLQRFQLFAGAQERGWIPGPEYLDESSEGQPQVLMHSFGRNMGEASLVKAIGKRSRLTNVRFWPLRLAVTGWLTRARKRSANQSTGSVPKKKSSVLIFPLLPGNTYEGEVVLARVDGEAKLSLWQRLFVWISFSFTSCRLDRRSVTSGEILADLEIDARVFAGNGDVAAFEEAYKHLTDMHETLLGACLARADDGSLGSWALLPDVFKFADRRVHDHWASVYRSLFEAAVSLLPNDTRPIRWLCHIVQNLDGPELQKSPIEIRDRILLIPTQLMYSLGNWWSQKLEEQGVLQHGQSEMALLRPPLQGAYEETLLNFVGGWESARQTLAGLPGRDGNFIWGNAKDFIRLNVRHINQTCLMLLKAVARGDQAAAEWLADIISKWWADASSYEDEPFVLYGKTDFITTEAVNQNWSVAEQSLGLDDDDRRFIRHDGAGLQKYVCLSALRNYWRDIRLLTLEILLSWAAEEGSQLSDRSLAIYVVTGLLTGRQWRGGGRTEEPLDELSAPDYLTSKARQYGADSNYREGYVARLDSFVESAKDILRPDMVPGRGYSFSGADDVRSLQDAQLIILVVLSVTEWRLGESLRRQLAVWTSANFRSTELVNSRASSMKRRLEEVGDNLCPDVIDRLLTYTGKPQARPEGITRVRNGIDKLLNEIEGLQGEAIANAEVSSQRIMEIEEAASERGFSKDTCEFPLQLFSAIAYEDTAQDPFTLVFSKQRKGEFTEVQMAQRAANEREYFAKTVANHVGMLLLADVIRKSKVTDVLAPDATTYWSVLKEEGAALKERGLTPVLILDNQTRPRWVWEWQHPRQDTEFFKPTDLVVRREKNGRGDGYIADFNDIQVFSGVIVAGESLLLARETFSSVTFKKYRDNVFVNGSISEVEESKTLVDLRLTYERNVRVEPHRVVRIRYELKNGLSDKNARKK